MVISWDFRSDCQQNPMVEKFSAWKEFNLLLFVSSSRSIMSSSVMYILNCILSLICFQCNFDEWTLLSSLLLSSSYLVILSNRYRYIIFMLKRVLYTLSKMKFRIQKKEYIQTENISSSFIIFRWKKKATHRFKSIVHVCGACVVRSSRKLKQLSLLLSIYWRPREQSPLKSVTVQQQQPRIGPELTTTKEQQHRTTPIGFLICHREKFPFFYSIIEF